jgi:CDP-paratose 2-epimerase
MTWLINGGCGFVGSNLADALLFAGESVTVVDNLSRAGSAQNLEWLKSRHKSEFEFKDMDTRDKDSLAAAIKSLQPSVVAHLAGQVSMVASLGNPRNDFEINTIGTYNALDAVRAHSPGSIFLFSSTNKVYGGLEYLKYEETETRYVLPDYPNGLDEKLQLDGQSPYGCSKLAADQYVRDYHRTYGIKTVVFRHSSMYGSRQFATFDQGWVGWFCQMARSMSDPSAPAFTISGDGKQVRDLLHASDLIEVYRLAVRNIDKAAGQIYNIGGGMSNSLSLLELFSQLEELTGHPMRYTKLVARFGDQKVFVADNAKAAREIGWRPEQDKVAGLKQMLKWTDTL